MKGFLKIFSLALITVFCLSFLSVIFTPLSVMANDLEDIVKDPLQTVGVEVGWGEEPEKNIYEVIAGGIKVILGVLGIVFIIVIIIAGFQWMTAGGNEEAIKSAKSKLVNAAIGLFVVLAAYAITHFLVEAIINATTD